MTALIHSLAEALSSIRRDLRRLLPMSLGIVWGMASVMVLLAVAGGFERSQKDALGAYGDRFVLLRLNRAELDRAAGGKERQLRMDVLDVERLRRGAPAIRRLSPMNMAYRARVTARNGAGTKVIIAGALPEISRLRNLPLAEGRFHNEIDEAERRRVIVLGPIARMQLFGRRPALGEKIRVAGFSTSYIPQREAPKVAEVRGRRGAGARLSGASRAVPATARTPGSSSPPTSSSSSSSGSGTARSTVGAVARDVHIQGELFEVIGVLKDVEIQRESYVSVARLAFVPFSTACVVFDDDYNTIFIEPRSLEERDLAVQQFTEVMGLRYGFERDDRNAVLLYFDSIERTKNIEAIFGTIRLFLSLVGAAILGMGAIGVMNAVLVSVTARRFEIGLRKALGATPLAIQLQFFAETVLGCFASGLLGFALGAGGIALVAALPLPQGFSRPQLDVETALISFVLLSVVAALVGVVPARRAARLPPVEALRSGMG